MNEHHQHQASATIPANDVPDASRFQLDYEQAQAVSARTPKCARCRNHGVVSMLRVSYFFAWIEVKRFVALCETND